MSLTELPREPEQPVALLDAAAVDSLVPPFPAADVDELRGVVHGPVYAAGDDGLAAEVATWNVAVTHTPAIAVGATCAADVAAAVSWAVARGLRVAVQATGHGPVRNAAGSMMITTRRMQGLFIDPERRTVRVEAGVKWKRLMESAAEFGLAGLCGSSSDVGAVGYTLGGGVGSLGRKHGFAADHVRAVEIVTADGRQRTLSADSEPELFWAVRGGKGNFGVVTALEMDLVPLTGLYGGGIFFAGEDMADVLHAFRRWSRHLPDEVSTSIAVMRLPDMEFLPPPLRGQTAVHLRYAYCGTDFADGERLVEPMKQAGRILLGFTGPMRTDEMDAIHMDPVDPLPAWEKGQLLTELTVEGVDALLAVAGPQAQIPLLMVELRMLGGAFARRPKVPNAVAGRDGAFSMLVLGPGVPELAEVVPAVGRAVLAAMAPWKAPGCLTNFLGDVSGPGEVAAAYPPGVSQRLAEVKAAVDPERVFSFGHAF
ncbi:FAD-binding oxidoreductase [Blastococcus sp. MG754426]|uniref:FAD-binding oxidoreductase n=1 Tax=unclassified Blastococcus TaxID=2619396 RepID=UPI001EF12791|nr:MULTISPECIES: FAD-binding oxidoreductase [unclassified Blastococcus]MCF6507680.1 FAD-binding oxidoreductase [Blastococcus sp. MG754426]MCF6511181.1 FAD-binding oxidoreductase [Blastococcus sp. MG754427]